MSKKVGKLRNHLLFSKNSQWTTLRWVCRRDCRGRNTLTSLSLTTTHSIHIHPNSIYLHTCMYLQQPVTLFSFQVAGPGRQMTSYNHTDTTCHLAAENTVSRNGSIKLDVQEAASTSSGQYQMLREKGSWKLRAWGGTITTNDRVFYGELRHCKSFNSLK